MLGSILATVGITLSLYSAYASSSLDNLRGGDTPKLTVCGTKPAAGNNHKCKNYESGTNLPCTSSAHKKNTKTTCTDFSDMSTTGITKKAQARKFDNESCQCIKYACKRVGTTGDKYDWDSGTKLKGKNWTKYLDGNQADKNEDCPPEEEE